MPLSATEHRNLAAGRAAFELVLNEPCHPHHARPSQPCWLSPHSACGSRIATALDRSRPKGPPPLDPPGARRRNPMGSRPAQPLAFAR